MRLIMSSSLLLILLLSHAAANAAELQFTGVSIYPEQIELLDARSTQQMVVTGIATDQSEQDLTRARLDYLSVVTEYNRAQFDLQRAVGGKAGSR